MIQTILIANRGEIACRIIRTCRKMGIRAVAVYSDADANTRHVREADEAVSIGPSPAGESYLVIQNIIAAAQQTGSEAVHPGFGFLAENADFARACADAGLIFIGPSPESIHIMGNKREAKMRLAKIGVPLVPGYNGPDQRGEMFLEAATHIGYPVMLKAVAGGGGKGMRIVEKPEEMLDAVETARREAIKAFGWGELMLEKALLKPRHIEFQVFGDQHGNLIHLGERECSIQRRHQKVIEESPSPAITADLRHKMGETAVSVARAVHYTNAGTVEFLLDETGNFYFLEMNTRLQVEHPVTEMVTGIDLVEWQIRVAEGEPLVGRFSKTVLQRGHAIEARLYAENPANDFLPVTGKVHLWREPVGEGVRVESGIQTGDEVSIYYDPMLAKMIAWGEDRKTAVRRLLYALENTTLLGLVNNLAFLCEVLRHPTFQAGELHTHFIQTHLPDWQRPQGDILLALTVATLIQFAPRPSPLAPHGYWRNNPNRPQLYRFQAGNEVVEVGVVPVPRSVNSYQLSVISDQSAVEPYTAVLHEQTEHEMVLTVNGRRQSVSFATVNENWWVQTRTGVVSFQTLPLLPEPKATAGAGGSLRAPMPGTVLAVLVEVGQRVSQGQALLKLEAMKMEHTIRTTADGVVEAIYYTPGDKVDADAQLVRIQEDKGVR